MYLNMLQFYLFYTLGIDDVSSVLLLLHVASYIYDTYKHLCHNVIIFYSYFNGDEWYNTHARYNAHSATHIQYPPVLRIDSTGARVVWVFPS